MGKASKVQSSSSSAATEQDQNTLLTGLIEALKDQNRLQGEQMRVILEANGSNHNNQEGGQAPVYKQFMICKPTDFRGSTDPIVSEEWMQSMETIFEFMQITEVERVKCATFMLKDDARIWWQGAKVALDLNNITWREFKEVFYRKYFTLSTRNKLAREFLEIKQGDTSIADYVKRFERGKYFAPMIIGDATMELNHFLEGLNATIRRDVRLSNPSSMRETVDRALMAEKDSQDILREAQAKRASYQGRDLHRPATKKPFNFNQSYNRTALPHPSYNQTAASQHPQQPRNSYNNNNSQRFSQRPQQQPPRRIQPAGQSSSAKSSNNSLPLCNICGKNHSRDVSQTVIQVSVHVLHSDMHAD